MSIPIDKLRAGSRWRHHANGNTYEVTGFSINTTSNQPDVDYKCIVVNAQNVLTPEEKAEKESLSFHRPIGEFLGHVKVGGVWGYRARFSYLGGPDDSTTI
jgi:hypothetical protein